MHYFIWL